MNWHFVSNVQETCQNECYGDMIFSFHLSRWRHHYVLLLRRPREQITMIITITLSIRDECLQILLFAQQKGVASCIFLSATPLSAVPYHCTIINSIRPTRQHKATKNIPLILRVFFSNVGDFLFHHRRPLNDPPPPPLYSRDGWRSPDEDEAGGSRAGLL